MKITIPLALFALAICYSSSAYADTFGSGTNMFEIEFVMIGNPDNADDTTGSPNPAGKVEYTYRIAKYEVSEDMIRKANALGGLGIVHSNRGANKPVTGVTWREAATFVNWLNTSTGHSPAYKFDSSGDFQLWEPGDAGYDPDNLYRNSLAFYFLPSMDEWYKAAYYDPIEDEYYDYPTGSNSRPDGIDFVGDPNFDAVFIDGPLLDPRPHDITNAGVLSPHGTAGQGGNVFEWEETETDLVNDSVDPFRSSRGLRGGSFAQQSTSLPATFRSNSNPANQFNFVGFRVASIPEPDTLWQGALAAFGFSMRRRNST